MGNHKTVLWWIRRDLRLEDNPALNAAVSDAGQVIPVYILDPYLLRRPADMRHTFLFSALNSLDNSLRARGSRLVCREGAPLEQLQRLMEESGAEKIYAEEDYSPYARRRDAQISAQVNLQLVNGLTVHHPALVHKPDGSPYAVFTAFSRAWKALPFPFEARQPAGPRLVCVSDLPSVPIPTGREDPLWPASEAEAGRRLQEFLSEPVYAYTDMRNRLDLPGTSVLSPYLRFGLISARRAASAVMLKLRDEQVPARRQGCETWLNELIWREFYQAILFYHPEVLRTAYQPAYRHISWLDSPADLGAWQAGTTGYPVVDAAMRQLSETGWMHNRARMITASFLVKNLLVNWQAGEAWFMQHLVDGDPASNNGGWQWTAGVGTDAAPYFRIFNPISQGLRHDPVGEYVRRYVPELRRVPLEYLHTPWLMPEDVQSQAGCRIGKDYPDRMIDVALTRERTLSAYKFSKFVETV